MNPAATAATTPRPGLSARRALWRWTPWALVAVALALRLIALDLRPPHSDEGVNGWFVERLLATGHYSYDPENYHGPLHYYLVALARLILGRNLWSLRLPTVLLGVATVWLTARCSDALGRRTAWLAALLLALSPAMVLYSRWAIHETEMLFFSVLVVRGLCRWWIRADRPALWMAGLGAAGQVATKEVWVLHAAVLGAACAAWWLLERGGWRRSASSVDARPPRLPVPLPPLRDLLLVAACGLVALALLYSGFLMDPAGLQRFFAPYLVWTERAIQGAGHDKPWWYWIELLARYEQPALLGVLAAPLALWRPARAHPLVRLLALYGLAILAAYSAVPYKTPWCVLQVVWPLCFVAAWVLAALSRRSAWIAGAAAATLALASLVAAVRLSYFRYDDAAEPYVYVQTYRDGLVPVELLRRAAGAEPALRQEPVHVLMRLSWPVPWLLAGFPRAGYWRDDQLPPGDALALFVDEASRAKVEPLLHRRYLVVPFKASPVHAPALAYFDAERLARWVPAGAVAFEPAASAPAPPSTR